MNCLKTYPKLKSVSEPHYRSEYAYTFLDIIKEYNLSPDIPYSYLLSIEEFKLRNIWNHAIKKWNLMKYDLNNRADFLNSDFSKNEYHQVHNKMSDKELNELISDFIDGNHVKCFFFYNSIINYITVK